MDAAQVGDQLEIATLLTTYARAVDSKDWELYRSVFTDDAFIDYSAEVIAGSLDEVIDFFRGDFSALVSMSMHYISNIETDIDGDTARVRAMFYNPTQIQGDGGALLFRRLLPPRTRPHTAGLAQPTSPRGTRVDGQLPA